MLEIKDVNQPPAPMVAGPFTDILKGVPEIAAFINETERRTYYMCERSMIPCGKLGSLWIASKTKLRRHYDRITGPVG